MLYKIIKLKGYYCIIHEHLPNKNQAAVRFSRFWGYTVITSRNYVIRSYIHHSVAHFYTDGNVLKEAVVIFKKTLSRSLVAAGASRFSVQK